MNVNMNGALLCTRACYRSMRERGGGAIVNQSSTAAWMGAGFYGLAKLGMNGLTHRLARELGPQKIRVNAIAPGPTDTEALRQAGARGVPQQHGRGLPLARLGTPDDMANACLFLLSDAASWVTGQIVERRRRPDHPARRRRAMALAPLAPETRNLIDGALVARQQRHTFENVNPATEEVIGAVRRRHAATTCCARSPPRGARSTRRAGRTNHAFRARCVRQLYEALQGGEGAAPRDRRAEAGAPVTLTRFMHVDDPIEMMAYWAEQGGDVPVRAAHDRHPVPRPPAAAASCAARPPAWSGAITPWNVPLYLNIAKLGPALAVGLHGRAEARARHAVVGDAPRQGDRGAHRHPRRRA